MTSSRHTVLTYLTATIICLVALFIQLRLWRADLLVPFYYGSGSDTDLTMCNVKTVMETGWSHSNPWLGAPGILDMRDFAQGDNLQVLFVKMIGSVAPDFGTTLNLVYMLGFLLTTWTSLFVLRAFGVSDSVAVAASLLYAFQPYHFIRGMLHLSYSFYWFIPLIVMVCLWLCEGQPVFTAPNAAGKTRFRWLRGRTSAALVACLLLGSSGAYYACFAAALVVVSGIVVLLRSFSGARLVDPLIALLLICTFFTFNLAPHLWYVRSHGKNPEVAHRDADDSLIHALDLASLIRPVHYHPLKGLAAALLGKDRPIPSPGQYYRTYKSEKASASLGLVGTCGLFALLLTLFLSRTPRGDLRLQGPLAKLNLAALLIGTTGGFGYLFALRVSPQIRGWARISIFIAFFSLMAVALLLEHVRRHRIKTTGARLLFKLGLGGILVAGIFDQMPQPLVPDHAAARAEFDHDRNFVREIEATLPLKAMIFQLPYAPFPEGHSPHVEDFWTFSGYVHLRSYLHSHHIHWSGGAMTGREAARWQRSVSEEPAAKLVADVIAKGFRGIWIDRKGYDDGTEVKLIADLRDLLHVEPIVDTRGYAVFFPLPDGLRESTGTSWIFLR